MVTIWQRDSLAELLRRLGREAAAAFASRAALRVVPLMAPLIDYSRTAGDAAGPLIILAGWRAAAASWLASGFATGAEAAAAATFVFQVEEPLSSDPAVLFSPPFMSAGAAAHAAAKAALAAATDGTSRDDAVDSAVSAAVGEPVAAMAAAAAALGGDSGAAAQLVQRAADADIAILIEDGGGALLTNPLWIEGVPAWLDQMWIGMRRELVARDPNWRVWTDWQEARHVGASAAPDAIEMGRIALGDFWKMGPAAANAEIARRIASPM